MLRGVGVLVVWAAWTFLVGATLLLTGNGGKAAGPGVAIAAMLVALVPTWFLLRAARYRLWLLAGATVVLVAVGLFLGSLGGPSLAQMTGVGASLPVATGAQLLTTSSVENTLCLQECSQVTHLYAVLDYDAATVHDRDRAPGDGWDALGVGTFCRGPVRRPPGRRRRPDDRRPPGCAARHGAAERLDEPLRALLGLRHRLQQDRHGSVVDQLDRHVGAEHPGRHLEPASAQGVDDGVDQRLARRARARRRSRWAGGPCGCRRRA